MCDPLTINRLILAVETLTTHSSRPWGEYEPFVNAYAALPINHSRYCASVFLEVYVTAEALKIFENKAQNSDVAGKIIKNVAQVFFKFRVNPRTMRKLETVLEAERRSRLIEYNMKQVVAENFADYYMGQYMQQLIYEYDKIFGASASSTSSAAFAFKDAFTNPPGGCFAFGKNRSRMSISGKRHRRSPRRPIPTKSQKSPQRTQKSRKLHRSRKTRQISSRA